MINRKGKTITKQQLSLLTEPLFASDAYYGIREERKYHIVRTQFLKTVVTKF